MAPELVEKVGAVARRRQPRAHVEEAGGAHVHRRQQRQKVARALGERRRAPREAEKDGRDGAARRQAEGPQVHLHVRWRWDVPPVCIRVDGVCVWRREFFYFDTASPRFISAG